MEDIHKIIETQFFKVFHALSMCRFHLNPIEFTNSYLKINVGDLLLLNQKNPKITKQEKIE